MKNLIDDTIASLTSSTDATLIRGMSVGVMTGLALALKDPVFASTAQLQLIQEWRSDPAMPEEYGPGEMANALLQVMKAKNN